MKWSNAMKVAYWIAGIVTLTATIGVQAAPTEATFREANPVWAQGRETEKNVTLGFSATVAAPESGHRTVLRLAAATVYSAFVNGEFIGAGPARGPHGWYRVDEWDITDRLRDGANTVAVEVAGYNTYSYALLNQPSFLQAEITDGQKVVAATGDKEGAGAFRCTPCSGRLQKVCRISFQRPFSEVYRLTPDWDAWRRNGQPSSTPVPLAIQESKQLLGRASAYPAFDVAPALHTVSRGALAPRTGEYKVRKPNAYDIYPLDQLESRPSVDIQSFVSGTNTPTGETLSPETPIALAQGQFAILDLGVNRTGLLGATVVCEKKAKVAFLFDEILTNNDVDFLRLGCDSMVFYELEPGRYAVLSMEPYVMRYVKVAAIEGDCTVSGVHLRQYVNSETDRASFEASDPRLNRLFTAGVETFRQNAVDVFMDCPSRERGGWLCDSFFTARVAKDVNGHARIEHDFVENFLLPKQYPFLPDGMLPMCYPSDHANGNFIPNWAMWFVLQLNEYAARSGDSATVQALKPKVLALVDYFKPFLNSDGLLEKLDKWVFVEWSAANDYVQDVNYPSNMLYASMLDVVANLYDRPDLAAQAAAARETIRKQSFDGHFFVDNALRKEGKLEVTTNRTEVCQYFAFYCGVATPESHPELWRVLRDEFGPKRAENKLYPEIKAANSFVGNMLRMEILSDNGRCEQILDESVDYLLYMADRTGTLWENTTPTASCNHGFASHIVHTLYRDILGLHVVDTPHKKLTLRFTDLRLTSCKGTLPTPDGPISLSWTRDGRTVRYTLSAPEHYKISVENPDSLELVAQPK